jgi:hypothetical protein
MTVRTAHRGSLEEKELVTSLTHRVVAMNAFQYRVLTGQREFRSIVIKIVDDKRIHAVTRSTVGAGTVLGGLPPGPIVDVVMAVDAFIRKRAIANGCAFSSGKE